MHNFFDWNIYNKGLGPREFDRVLNRKYNPELRAELVSKGYTEEELLKQIKIYENRNQKQIRRREQRSQIFKERITNLEKD